MTSTGLVGNASTQQLPDGSSLDAQASFTRSNAIQNLSCNGTLIHQTLATFSADGPIRTSKRDTAGSGLVRRGVRERQK